MIKEEFSMQQRSRNKMRLKLKLSITNTKTGIKGDNTYQKKFKRSPDKDTHKRAHGKLIEIF